MRFHYPAEINPAFANWKVSFFVCSSHVVALEVVRFSFVFLSLLPIEESLGIRGKRLNDTSVQQKEVTYAPDSFMRIDVKQSGGRLKVDTIDNPLMPKAIGAGETRKLSARVTNTGTTDISDIWLVLGDSGGGIVIIDDIGDAISSRSSRQEPRLLAY